MYKEKIKALLAKIDGKKADIKNNLAEAHAFVESDDLENARALSQKIEADKSELAEFENDLKMLEDLDATSAAKPSNGIVIDNNDDEPTYRERINNFIRSKGSATNGLTMEGKDEVLVPLNELVPTTDGVKKEDAKPVTSSEVTYTPDRELLTVIDLKQFVKVHKATKGKGSYPILAKPTQRMNSVDELEKNPKLAKPEFKDVSWEVKTYRGAVPISQESIDDADVDLVEIVAENTEGIKVNTTNYGIIETMKKFTEKEVSSVDDLKHIFNVDLDPAYAKIMVVSQTVYNWLDTLKDKNGRYLLQDSIVSASGKVFNGAPLAVVTDSQMGADFGWVGDAKRGILFADRQNLGLRWADNEIYGQYLQAVCRMDCKVADAKAGFYFNVKAPVEDTTK